MIVVTGGSGFVGAALLIRLAREHRTVRVVSRHPERLPGLLPPGIERVARDLLDPARVDGALDGADAVIHLAGALQGDPAQLRQVNVDGARNIATAARRRGVNRFLHLSSAGV